MKAVGRHLFTGFYGCDHKILNDMEKVKRGRMAKVTIVGARG